MNLGTTTNRQDIKTDEPVRQPAPRWLLLPVIGLYIVILVAIGLVLYEMRPPAAMLVFKASELQRETGEYESKNRKLKNQLDQHEKTKKYVKHKEMWAKHSIGAGDLFQKIVAALPEDVKLRGLDYDCQTPGTEEGVVVIGVKVQVRGTYEAARISAALERVDTRLAVSSSNQALTEQGMDVEMEYQVKQ